MRIVQTYWSGNKLTQNNEFGWLDFESNLLSWILSSNQLRRFYDDIELVTDKQGYSLLIEQLNLPYTNVKVILDDFNITSELWALAKIKSYSIQDKPFLHVDGDIYIWNKFPNNLLKAQLICQNLEGITDYSINKWEEIKPHLDFLPESMLKFGHKNNLLSCNMGIFGGHDLLFIKEYCKLAEDFVGNNLASLKKINLLNFNIFFEQVLFYMFACGNCKSLRFLFDYLINDNEYNFTSFDEVPNTKYLHIIGSPKRDLRVISKLRSYVLNCYPDAYKKVNAICNSRSKNVNNISSKNFAVKSKHTILKAYYHKVAFKKDSYLLQNDEIRILARDLFMYKNVQLYRTLKESQKPFIVLPLTDFKIISNADSKEKYIIVYHLDKNVFTTRFLSIDEIIFNELIKGGCSFFFKKNIFSYLSDDFPKNEMSNFECVIWSRLEFLISINVFASIPYKRNIKYSINDYESDDF